MHKRQREGSIRSARRKMTTAKERVETNVFKRWMRNAEECCYAMATAKMFDKDDTLPNPVSTDRTDDDFVPSSIVGLNGKAKAPFGVTIEIDGQDCYATLQRILQFREFDPKAHLSYFDSTRKSDVEWTVSPPGSLNYFDDVVNVHWLHSVFFKKLILDDADDTMYTNVVLYDYKDSSDNLVSETTESTTVIDVDHKDWSWLLDFADEDGFKGTFLFRQMSPECAPQFPLFTKRELSLWEPAVAHVAHVAHVALTTSAPCVVQHTFGKYVQIVLVEQKGATLMAHMQWEESGSARNGTIVYVNNAYLEQNKDVAVHNVAHSADTGLTSRPEFLHVAVLNTIENVMRNHWKPSNTKRTIKLTKEHARDVFWRALRVGQAKLQQGRRSRLSITLDEESSVRWITHSWFALGSDAFGAAYGPQLERRFYDYENHEAAHMCTNGTLSNKRAVHNRFSVHSLTQNESNPREWTILFSMKRDPDNPEEWLPAENTSIRFSVDDNNKAKIGWGGGNTGTLFVNKPMIYIAFAMIEKHLGEAFDKENHFITRADAAVAVDTNSDAAGPLLTYSRMRKTMTVNFQALEHEDGVVVLVLKNNTTVFLLCPQWDIEAFKRTCTFCVDKACNNEMEDVFCMPASNAVEYIRLLPSGAAPSYGDISSEAYSLYRHHKTDDIFENFGNSSRSPSVGRSVEQKIADISQAVNISFTEQWILADDTISEDVWDKWDTAGVQGVYIHVAGPDMLGGKTEERVHTVNKLDATGKINITEKKYVAKAFLVQPQLPIRLTPLTAAKQMCKAYAQRGTQFLVFACTPTANSEQYEWIVGKRKLVVENSVHVEKTQWKTEDGAATCLETVHVSEKGQEVTLEVLVDADCPEDALKAFCYCVKANTAKWHSVPLAVSIKCNDYDLRDVVGTFLMEWDSNCTLFTKAESNAYFSGRKPLTFENPTPVHEMKIYWESQLSAVTFGSALEDFEELSNMFKEPCKGKHWDLAFAMMKKAYTFIASAVSVPGVPAGDTLDAKKKVVRKVSNVGFGYGAFAKKDIATGVAICYYGDIVKDGSVQGAPKDGEYAWHLGDDWEEGDSYVVADPKNVGALLQHADNEHANVTSENQEISGRRYVVLVATKDIKEGEELVHDYGRTYPYKKMGFNRRTCMNSRAAPARWFFDKIKAAFEDGSSDMSAALMETVWSEGAIENYADSTEGMRAKLQKHRVLGPSVQRVFDNTYGLHCNTYPQTAVGMEHWDKLAVDAGTFAETIGWLLPQMPFAERMSIRHRHAHDVNGWQSKVVEAGDSPHERRETIAGKQKEVQRKKDELANIKDQLAQLKALMAKNGITPALFPGHANVALANTLENVNIPAKKGEIATLWGERNDVITEYQDYAAALKRMLWKWFADYVPNECVEINLHNYRRVQKRLMWGNVTNQKMCTCCIVNSAIYTDAEEITLEEKYWTHRSARLCAHVKEMNKDEAVVTFCDSGVRTRVHRKDVAELPFAVTSFCKRENAEVPTFAATFLDHMAQPCTLQFAPLPQLSTHFVGIPWTTIAAKDNVDPYNAPTGDVKHVWVDRPNPGINFKGWHVHKYKKHTVMHQLNLCVGSWCGLINSQDEKYVDWILTGSEDEISNELDRISEERTKANQKKKTIKSKSKTKTKAKKGGGGASQASEPQASEPQWAFILVKPAWAGNTVALDDEYTEAEFAAERSLLDAHAYNA